MKIKCVYQRDNMNVIQEAIDACPDTGGTVVIPAGEWYTKKLHLKSNLVLQLEEGCVVHFSDQPEDYLPVVFTRWEGVECYNYSPLIYAKDCTNITITGNGVFDGNGQKWWKWKQLQQSAATALCEAESKRITPEDRIFGTEQAALRPSFIQFIHCSNIILRDFTIQEGPQWTIHPVYCENVYVGRIKVYSHGPNTDGLNPDSCKNVLIEQCLFHTGDDGIAINSGLNEDGWRVNVPCEGIEIRECVFTGGHAAIAIGSGMSGGVKNVWAHDCIIRDTERGIRLKSMRGRGGYINHVCFEDMTISNVEEEAIQVSMNYGSSTAVPVSDKAPVFSDISFKRIHGSGAKVGVELRGLPESPLEVQLKDVKIEAECPSVTEYIR